MLEVTGEQEWKCEEFKETHCKAHGNSCNAIYMHVLVG